MMSQLGRLDGRMDHSPSGKGISPGAKSLAEIELSRARIQLADSHAENQQLRDGLSRLEDEIEKYSACVAEMKSNHAALVSTSAGALVSGLVYFELIKGPMMTKASLRLFCLHKSQGFIFDTEAQKIEHNFAYSDVNIKAKLAEGELVMDIDSRIDALTFRVRVPVSQVKKWRWAFEELFGSSSGTSSLSSDQVGQEGVKTRQTRTSALTYSEDESEEDDGSVNGSLSSLASEVRLALPPFPSRR